MSDGERVTTGSEPRRFRVGLWQTDGAYRVHQVSGEPIKPGEDLIEVVERGHDERPATREPDEDKCSACGRTMSDVFESVVEWQPDERTVKAVVEALEWSHEDAPEGLKFGIGFAINQIRLYFNLKGTEDASKQV